MLGTSYTPLPLSVDAVDVAAEADAGLTNVLSNCSAASMAVHWKAARCSEVGGPPQAVKSKVQV